MRPSMRFTGLHLKLWRSDISLPVTSTFSLRPHSSVPEAPVLEEVASGPDQRGKGRHRADKSLVSKTLFSKEFQELDSIKKKSSFKIKPVPKPSFTFAAYVNESTLLQNFVKLGVNLVKWEKGTIPDEIMGLDFERDVTPVLFHLHGLGIPDEQLGKVLTKNPYILISGVGNLEDQTDYFVRKKFSREQLINVVIKCPQLFSRSVEAIDGRLGYFQQTFDLTGDQLRDSVTICPELFQAKLSILAKLNFHMAKSLGFKQKEMRELFIVCPSVFLLHPDTVAQRFHILHNTMGIPHQTLVRYPLLFRVPPYLIRQRHKFLSTLGRANYDPLDESYVTLTAFTNHGDQSFAEKIAGVSYDTYKQFLKTQ